MKLRLQKNEHHIYELLYGDSVLLSTPTLSHAVDRGQKYAKNFRRKLYLCESCVEDWYVGFPKDSTQAPEVFYDPQAVTASASTSAYRFLEGPFVTKDEALEAGFKIAGKAGVEKT